MAGQWTGNSQLQQVTLRSMWRVQGGGDLLSWDVCHQGSQSSREGQETDLLSHGVLKALVMYGTKHRGLTLGRGSMKASWRVYVG